MINSPDSFPAFFSYDKSVFWRAFRGHPVHKSHSNEFSIPVHKIAKKRVAAAYQMSAVLKDEAKMDKHIEILEQQFKKRLGQKLDFAPWAIWIAFDIVMEMVFSAPFGFVEAAYDIDNINSTIQGLIALAVLVGTFPWLSALLSVPWINRLLAPKPTDTTGPGKIHGMAYQQVRKRFDLLQDAKQKPNDVLQRIIDKTNADGEHLPKEVIDQEALQPVMAGSDSTAAQLRAAVLYLSTYPRVLAKFREEIDAADKAGKLSPVAQYNEIKAHIPYMDLLQNELMRMYPVVGGPLPRETPKGGATLHEYFIPAGTDVSLSQWAVSRNPEIFGDDIDSFRPERWEYSSSSLNSVGNDADFDESGTISGASKEESGNSTTRDEFVRRMRTTGVVFFSQGATLCTGRNIAVMELYKLIVHLFRTFDFQIVDPTKPWKELNRLAMLHSDFWVVIEERRK